MSGYTDIPPKSTGTGGGISSINGDSTTSQIITVGTSGTAPVITTSSGTTTINIPLASAAGVTAGLLSNSDQTLINALGDKYARTTRFVSISAGTSGAIALPTSSTVVLNDFGGTVSALVSAISSGHPTFTNAVTSGGVTVTTTFDSAGNWVFSGIPSFYPVSIVYRVTTKSRFFDSTSIDIVGSVDYEAGALQAINNLNDVLSTSSARTNLGLGSLSTVTPTGSASTSTFLRGDNSWATATGSGVAGPGSSVSGNIATFSGTTGQTIQDGLISSASFDAAGAATAAQAASLQKSNNLSDLALVSTARTNLGLGSAATSNTTAFDAAGAATTAQAFAIQRVNHTGTQAVSTLTGALPIGNGGSGQITQALAVTALTGVQTSGQYLRSDGTNSYLNAILAADVPTLNQSTTGTSSNITAASNSTLTTLSSLSLPGSQVSGNISGKASNVTGVVTIINGGTSLTSVVTVPAASTFSAWDGSSNFSANSYLRGTTATVTSGTTTTLTVTSTQFQLFTGSTTQTVVLPSALTLGLGQSFILSNSSTGAVTVNTNGGALLVSMASGTIATHATLTLMSLGTAAGTWDINYSAPAAAGFTNPMTTGGDLIYGGAAGTATRLGNGAAGQVLTSGGSTLGPAWTTVTGTGSVTSTSVVSANGFAGTVANPTTTPAITISTIVTGLLKGNGTSVSAAASGTDYVIPSGSVASFTGALSGDITGTQGATVLASAGTAGTYGSATQVPVITTDSKGRVTSVVNTTITPSSTGTFTAFTSSASFAQPATGTMVHVTMIAGGGGGGSGRLGAAASIRNGGSGGSAGTIIDAWIPFSAITFPVTVTVGAGGGGGAAISTIDISGNSGGTGGNSSFGTYLVALGGQPGPGGGSNGGPSGPSFRYGSSGGGGLGNGNGGGGNAGGFGFAGSGGGGGGVTTGNIANSGGAGGTNIAFLTTGAGGAVGTAGGAGTDGNTTTPYANFAGSGGGGGGGSITASAGGAGGNGGRYGSGGGGGGAALDTTSPSSGAGGNGGQGIVLVETY